MCHDRSWVFDMAIMDSSEKSNAHPFPNKKKAFLSILFYTISRVSEHVHGGKVFVLLQQKQAYHRMTPGHMTWP